MMEVEVEDGAVSAVFRNVSILSRIMELSDFKKLKELRLVNKSWNETACLLLRKLCKAVQVDGWGSVNFKKFDSEMDPLLPNRDIIAKLPLNVFLEFDEDMTADNLNEFLENRFASARWIDQVVRVQVNLYVTVADINMLTPFLLHHLPCLEKLGFIMGSPHLLYGQGNSFTVPSFAADLKFKLKYIKYDWHLPNEDEEDDGPLDQELDATFLRHCQNLRIAFTSKWAEQDCLMGEIFLGFYRSWKKMLQENPYLDHRIQQFKFDFYLDKVKDPSVDLKKVLVDFIRRNKPTRLNIRESYNSILLRNIGFSTDSIQFLKMAIPTEINVSHADSAVRMLKNCPSFVHLTELYLDLKRVPDERTTGRPFVLDPEQFRVRSYIGLNKLANVVSLTVRMEHLETCNVSVLEQVAVHLSRVCRLTLILPGLTSYDKYYRTLGGDPGDKSVYNHLDEILGDCRGFRKLQCLCFDVEVISSSGITSERVDAIQRKKVYKGFFSNLSVVTGLKKLEIKITHPCDKWNIKTFSYSVEEILIALFHGYEPQVLLGMEFYNKCGNEINRMYSSKFTVEQFKHALKEAEGKLLKFSEGRDTDDSE